MSALHSRSAGRNSNLAGPKLLAILVVAVMVLSAIPVLGSGTADAGDTDATAYPAHTQTITYYEHVGDTSNGVSFTYNGIASTEYNPQFVPEFSGWDEWGNAEIITISGSGSSDVTIDFKFKVSVDFSKGGSFALSPNNGWKNVSIVDIPTVTVNVKDGKKTVTYSSEGTYQNNTITFPKASYTQGKNTYYLSTSSVKDVTIALKLDISVPISGGSVNAKHVFCGWTTADGSETIYPGDVVGSEVETLYAKWTTQDVFVGGSSVGNITYGGKSYDINNPPSYNANAPVCSGGSSDVLAECPADRADDYTLYLTGGRTKATMFSSIYLVNGDSLPSNLKTGTYRSASGNGSVDVSSAINCKGDVIIDNLHLNTGNGGSHGDSGYGIYANGHRLIIGTNADATSGYRLQVFGGSASDRISTAVEAGKKIVSLEPEMKDLSVDIGTYVIIHSGTYSNVVAGGQGYSVGKAPENNDASTGIYLSTYMVMKGGTVTDTVVGGSAGNGSVYAANGASSSRGVNQGGTFVYITGLKMTADTWEEGELGVTTDYHSGHESSILEGGCSKGQVMGSTHVFLTGTSDLWDAQAGGRRGTTYADFGYMEISGNAVVRHVACGTITDGKKDGDHKDCVGSVKLIMRDNAKVAMLVGAGYDTWYYPEKRSMLSGTVDVVVKNGEAGFVYGGGYRGSIGTPGSESSMTVNVTILGGTVVNDVFGGGRGGVDKIQHNDNQYGITDNTDHVNDRVKSTGRSYVYGNVNVYIRGGDIMGNVYGGGESVPVLESIAYSPDDVDGFNADEGDGAGKTNYVATVTGSTHVEISGKATIYGNVYGAGKGVVITDLEYADGTYSGGVPGTVGTGYYSEMYVYKTTGFGWMPWFKDAGVPTYNSDLISAYLEYAKVGGNSSVSIMGGTVKGNVYGGGAYGKVYGNTEVDITGGRIEGNVYGGGVGHTGITSVTGTRTITLLNADIVGSVYGGTAYGDDGDVSENSPLTSDISIYMQSGTIGGSIFGGGFKGKTGGDVSIYVGYDVEDRIPLTSGSISESGRTKISIGQSIYIGGDVGELSATDIQFTKTLVLGGGDLHIYGGYSDISLRGSLMGSGNACLTEGDTSIDVDLWNNPVQMEAIHRANEVHIESSTLVLNGRSTVDPTVADSLYTLYGIEKFILKNETSLTLNNPVEHISEFRSQNKDGADTTPSSPSNKLTVGSGNALIIRDQKTGGFEYGHVYGYTILSINNAEGDYGGYALGSIESSGGFVVMNKGSYVPADFTDLTGCRCWFISGTISNSMAVTLEYEGEADISNASIMGEMTKLLDKTYIKYAGGTFVASNRDAYSMVNTPGEKGQFSMTFGDNVDRRVDDLYFASGAEKLIGAHTTASVLGTIDQDASGNMTKNPFLHIAVSGLFDNKSQYVGYCTIYMQEVTKITYKDAQGNDAETYILTNSIQLTIDIYTKGTSDRAESTSVTIGTVAGNGSVDIMVPSGLYGYSVSLVSVTAGGTYGSNLTVEAQKNINNTPGWTNMNGVKPLYPAMPETDAEKVLGLLNGGYTARITFSVSDFISPDGDDGYSETYHVTLCTTGGPNASEFTVFITVYALPEILVTFHDDHQDSRIEVSFPYGSLINEADCPPTLDNFIGWYYDPEFETAYSYSTPLTDNVDLYARYMWVVTFDNQDGTSNKWYIAENPEGALIVEPTDPPTRFGYEFYAWYQDSKCINQWDFNKTIFGSMTLYAKWNGYSVNVHFIYDEDELVFKGKPYVKEVKYGGVFGVLDLDASVFFEEDVTILGFAQYLVEDLIKHEEGAGAKKFIRWQMEINGKNMPVYDDTLVSTFDVDPENPKIYSVALRAMTSNVALQVTMSGNSTDLTTVVDAPVTFLVFPEGGEKIIVDADNEKYVFKYVLNDATRSGWLLKGWALKSNPDLSDPSSYYGCGSLVEYEVYTKKDGAIQYGPDGVTPMDQVMTNTADPYTITYYAVWEQIPYKVTVMDSANGVIDAFYGGKAGKSFTAYYGDRITLRFTPNPGYEFAKWIVSGEGTVTVDGLNGSATLVVVGDCAVYANTVGPQIMQLYVKFNGGTEFSDEPLVPQAALSRDGTNAEYVFGPSEYDSVLGIYKYPVIADTGSYSICLVGDNGRLFRIGEISVGTDRNSYEVSVVTVTNSIVDDDKALSYYTQYLVAGENVNVQVMAGHEYDISYRIGNGAVVPLEKRGAQNVDRSMWFQTDADNPVGIEIMGTVNATIYTLNYHLVCKYDKWVSETFATPASVPVRFGTVLSSLLPGDEDIKDAGNNTLADKKYSITAWYLGYTPSTGVYVGPVTATMAFDETLLNSRGVIDVYARIIDITQEVPVHINELVMDTEGVYRSPVQDEIIAHAIPGETEETQHHYEGTYVLGDYASFSRNITIRDIATKEPIADAVFSLNGNELYFLVIGECEIVIEYVRPSVAVSFSVGNGTIGPVPSSAYFEQVLTMPEVTPPEKYNMIGWKISGKDGALEPDAEGDYTYAITSRDCEGISMAFVAVYEPVSKYALTFITEHGTFSNGYTRISYPVGVGEDIRSYFSENVPVVGADSPYSFSNSWSPSIVNVMPDHDLEYTANWTIGNFLLTFEGLDEHVSISATMDSTPISNNSPLPYYTNVTLTILFDLNYTLGDYYPSGSIIGSTPVEASSNREFVWSFFITKNTSIQIGSTWAGIAIYFSVNGEIDESLTIMPVEKYSTVYFDGFSHVGYENASWYTRVDLSEQAEYDAEKGQYVARMVLNDLTYYSNPTPYTYYVKFMDGETDLCTDGPVPMQYDHDYRLTGFNKPVRDGYLFVGWEFDGKYYIADDTVRNLTTEKGAVVDGVVTNPLVFQAVWLEIPEVVEKYDGTGHYGSIAATHGTVYYGTSKLTSSNYSTDGSVQNVKFVNASSYDQLTQTYTPYQTYYYIITESQNSGKTSVFSGSFPVTVEKRAVTFTSGTDSRIFMKDDEGNPIPLTNHLMEIIGDGIISADSGAYMINWTGTISEVADDGTDWVWNTYDVVWDAAKAGNYDCTYNYGTLTILPVSTSIVVEQSEYDKVYGDSGFTIVAYAKDDPELPLMFESDNIGVVTVGNDGSVTIVGYGNARITISLAEQDESVEADPAYVSITVERKVLTVTYSPAYDAGTAKDYDGNNTVPTVLNFGISGLVPGDETKVKFETSCVYSDVNAGNVPINVLCTISGEKSANYTVSNITVPGIINPRTITLESPTMEKDFDGSPLTATDVTVNGTLVGSDAFSDLRARGTITNVGSVQNEIVYAFAKGTVAGNYNVVCNAGTLTVNVRLIDVPGGIGKEYTGSPISATSAFPLSPYYNVYGDDQTEVGDYTARLELKYKGGNTMWNLDVPADTDQVCRWSIAQLRLDPSYFVGVNLDSVTYDGNPMTKVFDSETVPELDSGNYLVTYMDNVNAGIATIIITGTGSYTGEVRLHFQILKADLTVVLEPTFADYDGKLHYINYSLRETIPEKDRIELTLNTKGDGVLEIGEYQVTLISINSTNYQLSGASQKEATLTIGRAVLVLVAKSAITSITVTDALECNEYVAFGYLGDDITGEYDITVEGKQDGVGYSVNHITYTLKEGVSSSKYQVHTYDGTLTILKTGYSSIVVSNTLPGE